MHTFAKVVELGAFAAAAARLELAPSAVTKQVAFLERKYGVRLLNRTTRKLSLTDAGRAFYERIRPLLAELEELELALQADIQRPSGKLRISAPFSFGILHLGPAVAEFMRLYPEVAVDLELSDRRVDLVEEGFDLALRIAPMGDSTLVARQLAEIKIIVCAAPSYLAEHGTPQHPDDLKQHSCLNYTYSSSGNVWDFVKDGQTHLVSVEGSFRANNGDVIRTAALAGHGLIMQPDFIIGADLAAGRLVPVLPEYNVPSIGLYAVYPHRRFLSAKVRSFVEHLEQRFKAFGRPG
jgi:DNA-binding transcriptional LysR family regulator